MPAPERTPHPSPIPARPGGQSGGYLKLVGVSEDGRSLRLADPHDPFGGEFTVEIDARLRAALGPDPRYDGTHGPHSAQHQTRTNTSQTGGGGSATVETQMESMLRPRDIQARIRAGETPEQIAAAARTTVEKVMPYAAPVLAEREHVAMRAQRSSIRRPAGEGASAPGPGARTLGEAITGHLHERNIGPEAVTWDAWRREDGRWMVTGRFSIQGREGLAELIYDQPGNYVILDNDDARWLVGDSLDPAPDAAAPAAPATEPGRRLSAVPSEDSDQLALDPDVLGITDEPIEAFLDERPTQEQAQLTEEVADAIARDADVPQADEPPSEPPRRAVKKTRGRASVPSWDEIMFGPGE